VQFNRETYTEFNTDLHVTWTEVRTYLDMHVVLFTLAHVRDGVVGGVGFTRTQLHTNRPVDKHKHPSLVPAIQIDIPAFIALVVVPVRRHCCVFRYHSVRVQETKEPLIDQTFRALIYSHKEFVVL
jgi:hypothetical protein